MLASGFWRKSTVNVANSSDRFGDSICCGYRKTNRFWQSPNCEKPSLRWVLNSDKKPCEYGRYHPEEWAWYFSSSISSDLWQCKPNRLRSVEPCNRRRHLDQHGLDHCLDSKRGFIDGSFSPTKSNFRYLIKCFLHFFFNNGRYI